MLGFCGGGTTGYIRARCGYRNSRKTYQCIGNRVRGAPYSHRVKSAGNAGGDGVLLFHYHRERSRHKAGGEPVIQGSRKAIRLGILGVRDMDYQRIVGRPAFCSVYFVCRFFVGRISAESVYRLGGEYHQTAAAYGIRGGLKNALVKIFRVKSYVRCAYCG